MGRLKYNIEEGNPFSLPASQQKLSILVGMDSFDYIVTDAELNICAFKSYALNQPISGNSYSEFEDFFRSDTLLNRNYGTCFFTSFAPYFTIVPANLFKKGDHNQYLNQVAELGKTFEISYQAIGQRQHYNVFAVHYFLKEWCQSHFSNGKHRHLIGGMVEYALLNAQNGQKDQVYFYRSGIQLGLVLIKDQQLHFANIFEVSSPEQLIYFIGLVINQFKIDQLATDIFLMDGFEKEDELTLVIQQYLNNVKHQELPNQLNIGMEMQLAPYKQLLLPAIALI